MICRRCARAADQRAPRDQHCADPKCMCGHRVERYQPLAETTGLIAVPELLTKAQADAVRARWIEHYEEHTANGTICIHSASRLSEELDARTRLNATTED